MRPERVEINRGRQRQPGPSIRRLLLRRAPLEQRPLPPGTLTQFTPGEVLQLHDNKGVILSSKLCASSPLVVGGGGAPEVASAKAVQASRAVAASFRARGLYTTLAEEDAAAERAAKAAEAKAAASYSEGLAR